MTMKLSDQESFFISVQRAKARAAMLDNVVPVETPTLSVLLKEANKKLPIDQAELK